MQELSATLSAAQKAMGKVLYRIVLTKAGEDTQTYTTSRVINIKYIEQENRQTADVLLDNADGTLTDLDLRGYQGVISFGYTTSGGDEYAARPPMWVIGQQLISQKGRLRCILSLAGLFNRLAEDRASEIYAPTEDDTDTVKDLLTAIAEATLGCYDHCTAYTITFDSEDSLIDTFQPKDGFRIDLNRSRMSAMEELISYTGCVMRPESDGEIHVFVPLRTEDAATWEADTVYALRAMAIPTTANGYYYACTTAGTSHATTEPTWPTTIGATVTDGTVVWTVAYDYEYELGSGNHPFFSLANRKRLVMPNYISVASHPSHTDQYSGYAEDTDSSDLIEDRKYYELRLASDAQATSIAQAILKQYQIGSEKGSAIVPINVGAEIYDYVNCIDTSDGDEARQGNIGYISIQAGQNKFQMEIRFGDIALSSPLGTFSTSSSGGGGDWSEIYNYIDNLFQRFIQWFIDYISELPNPYEGYIYIDQYGDIILLPKYGRYVRINLGDLFLDCGEKFGIKTDATEACRLFWNCKDGTLQHAFCPDTTGYGKVGDATYYWGEIRGNNGYFNTTLYIPAEA